MIVHYLTTTQLIIVLHNYIIEEQLLLLLEFYSTRYEGLLLCAGQHVIILRNGQLWLIVCTISWTLCHYHLLLSPNSVYTYILVNHVNNDYTNTEQTCYN